ncbi:hypothetical protein GCM10022232_74710 [Streptomyces plumbiresistens]|uniref:Uncharacterized protein n=1 Tax=Streptomyces plumbiresistens TaxID=511811 RepID=A0ABP7T1M1_9ACTN
MEGEFEQGMQPVALGCGEELAGFVSGEGFEASGPWGAGADVAGDVARDLFLASVQGRGVSVRQLSPRDQFLKRYNETLEQSAAQCGADEEAVRLGMEQRKRLSGNYTPEEKAAKAQLLRDRIAEGRRRR